MKRCDPGSATLRVEGYAARLALERGPLRLSAEADGRPLGGATVDRPDAHFTADFKLPPNLAGDGPMRVALEVNRTFRSPGDPRDLGLAISSVALG